MRNKEYDKRYAASPAGRASLVKYRRSDKFKRASLRQHLRSKFGLSETDVERMFAHQEGKCACCFDEITLVQKSPGYRHIDHDHSKRKGDAGFIRGLLCHYCNIGLGAFFDKPGRLRLAIKYLED